MKKSIIITFVLLFFYNLNVVKSQFDTIHYYSGNCTITSDNVIGGVAVDANNNKWFGTDNGVSKFDGNTWTNYTVADGLPSNIISCIAVDHNNNVWVGTDGDGVAKYDGTTWAKYTASDGLCDNGIFYIAGDNNGDVWFGSGGAGVSKLSAGTWTTYTTGLPLDGSNVAAINYITIDGLGNKWFGTTAGLTKYDGTSWTVIDQTSMDSLINNKIETIAIDASNNIWVGTLSGVTKINSSNTWVKNYRHTDGLYNNGVRDIKIDVSGNIWFGLYTDYNFDAGITRFNGSSWVSESIDYPSSVAADWIYGLAKDNNNDIWVAMDYGTLKINHTSSINELFEKKDITIYPNPSSGNITIEGNFSGKNSEVCILNSTGKIVMHNQNTGIVDLSALSEGVYFVQILSDNAIVANKKLVLVK